MNCRKKEVIICRNIGGLFSGTTFVKNMVVQTESATIPSCREAGCAKQCDSRTGFCMLTWDCVRFCRVMTKMTKTLGCSYCRLTLENNRSTNCYYGIESVIKLGADYAGSGSLPKQELCCSRACRCFAELMIVAEVVVLRGSLLAHPESSMKRRLAVRCGISVRWRRVLRIWSLGEAE